MLARMSHRAGIHLHRTAIHVCRQPHAHLFAASHGGIDRDERAHADRYGPTCTDGDANPHVSADIESGTLVHRNLLSDADGDRRRMRRDTPALVPRVSEGNCPDRGQCLAAEGLSIVEVRRRSTGDAE